MEKQRDVLVEAKKTLQAAVQKKKRFGDFLGLVVNSEPEIYADIKVLMMRCSALVATKNKLQSHLDFVNESVDTERNDLEKFKEDKMKQTLEYNVRLVNMQKKASGLQAKTLERRTFLSNLEEKIAEKK